MYPGFVVDRRNVAQGTWQFMSAILTYKPDKLHEPSDDLESSMHVLSWVILKCLKNPWSFDQDALVNQIRSRFENFEKFPAGPDGLTRYRCSSDKHASVRNGIPIAELLYEDHPLQELLVELARLCKKHYKTLPVPSKQIPIPTDAEGGNSESSYPPIFTLPPSLPPTAQPTISMPPPPVPVRPSMSSSKDSKITESPLKDHTRFLSAFAKCLDARPWPAIERQAAVAPSVASTTCSLPPASSLQTGDKRPRGNTSGSQTAKRARRGKRSGSSRMGTSSVASSVTAQDGPEVGVVGLSSVFVVKGQDS